MFKKILCVLTIVLFGCAFADDNNITINVNNANNGNYSEGENYPDGNGRYDYVYYNPPRPSIMTNGRYIMIGSGVRYSHSPSKHKRASHAARINAYNYQAMNY